MYLRGKQTKRRGKKRMSAVHPAAVEKAVYPLDYLVAKGYVMGSNPGRSVSFARKFGQA